MPHRYYLHAAQHMVIPLAAEKDSQTQREFASPLADTRAEGLGVRAPEQFHLARIRREAAISPRAYLRDLF